MNKIFILGIYLHLVCALSAQITFQKTINGPESNRGDCVFQTADNGYIFLGSTSGSSIDYNVILLKTYAFGDTLWTKRFLNPIYYPQPFLALTSDEGFVIASKNGNTIYLFKTDSFGGILFTKIYSGVSIDGSSSVQQTMDGGFIIAGACINSMTFDDDILLMKTDANGDTLWVRTYDVFMDDGAYAIRQTTDGGFIISGFTDAGSATNYDFCLLRTDSAGNVLWAKTYGTAAYDYGFDVQETDNGGFIFSGNTPGGNLLIRTDGLGYTLWIRQYPGSNFNKISSIAKTDDGGFVMVATATDSSFNEDIYVARVSSSGNGLWTRIYGLGTSSDVGASAAQTMDGGFVICGSRSGPGAPFSEMYLIKTDSLGNSGCYETALPAFNISPVIQEAFVNVTTGSITLFVGTQALMVSPGYEGNTLCMNVGVNPPAHDESEDLLYPNPTVKQFALHSLLSCRVEIFNIPGEKVYFSTVDRDELIINIENFRSGIYFVKIQTEKGTAIKKLVIR